MSNDAKPDDLAHADELFAFLQGNVPEGYTIPRKQIPRLTPDQAWTVIWYLGNQYWQVPDHIERCCVCGDLYDSENAGACLDYGKAPYNFCQCCCDGEAYQRKAASKLDPANKTT